MVNISKLKARLSSHIERVKNGEEVVVCDRKKPVARIVPVQQDEFSKREQRLVARGVLSPPRRQRSPRRPWPQPPGQISDEVMQQIWREEREGR